MYAEKPKYYTTASGGSALGLFGEASNLLRGLLNSSSDGMSAMATMMVLPHWCWVC